MQKLVLITNFATWKHDSLGTTAWMEWVKENTYDITETELQM